MFSEDRNSIPAAFMAADRGDSAAHHSGPAGELKQDLKLMSKIPRILPHERVFPIQIGSKLFKLSGASLSSDAAEENGDDVCSSIRTLYIDRDPMTFQDIALHLQGYHVHPRDATHFVRLFADAQFYSLPKLISQLYEEPIFMTIGHREFQIPRDLFKDPGNSPNFFTLGFAIFFSSPDDLFPGLDRRDLIRPPSILPPSVPHRSADTFEEILHLLRGNPVNVRDETHRQTLLRDVRYFNFKGLEQRLISHCASYNQLRARHQILLRVEDIYKSGISVYPEPPSAVDSAPSHGWVNYARPYLGDKPAELVLQIGGNASRVGPLEIILRDDFAPLPDSTVYTAQLEFFLDAKKRVARLFDVVGSLLKVSVVQADQLVAIIDKDAAITLDGKPFTGHRDADDLADIDVDALTVGTDGPARKRRKTVASRQRPGIETAGWVIRTGQWRLRTRCLHGTLECLFVAVKLEAFSSEHSSNSMAEFL
ncbi:BTB/POZ domain-containing protein [Pyricularia oryzae Y34]|uniref:BTB/POZ domain-containing protein n=2 Tax=Pyricularia oryzae TaxID=318829 RepID=A0AA97PL38_PYRO3|nr:BTB/POZ domain-containing protein [Pyricularia oryzae Y34]